MKTVNLGVFGLGTVGTGFMRVLQAQAKAIEKKTGIRLVVKKVCVKNLAKKRKIKLRKNLITKDPKQILDDPSIDIVVELIGGMCPAREIVLSALKNGKHVVTANKALLAEKGSEIFAAAKKHKRQLHFEASVCGGIPIIQAMQQGLSANHLTRFLGIVNGTSNYILTARTKTSVRYQEALKQAQEYGYAEQDPAFDIDGSDCAHKLVILARLGFGIELSYKKIYKQGIQKIQSIDLEYAKGLGYKIKLLAIGKKHKGDYEFRVHPTLLSAEHPLANVEGVYNAIFLHGNHVGDLLFYGKGAGMMPTASAVMADVVDASKHVGCQWPGMGDGVLTLPASKFRGIDMIHSKYYLRFQVMDKPGVLGRIAKILGKHKISILSVHQKEPQRAKSVPVVVLTYEAMEKNLRSALRIIDNMPEVHSKTVVMRVEK